MNKDFFCENCKLQFGKKYVFDLHLSLVHGKQMIEVKPEPIDGEENVQEPEIFGQNIEVKREPFTGKENVQECEVFEKDSSKGLQRLTGSVQKNKKPFKCNICDADFARNHQLKVHKDSVHERKKPSKCNICDASFSDKGSLKKNHQRYMDRILK